MQSHAQSVRVWGGGEGGEGKGITTPVRHRATLTFRRQLSKRITYHNPNPNPNPNTPVEVDLAVVVVVVVEEVVVVVVMIAGFRASLHAGGSIPSTNAEHNALRTPQVASCGGCGHV